VRIGFGYDVHPLVAGRKLLLGGVEIPFDKGLGGHSDADVLSHAVGDALLGSVGLGDIGQHFPDSDERFAGISSLLLLKQIAELLRKEDYGVVNIDSTVVMERPKLAPHIVLIRKNMADSLAIDPSRVSVKATTSEKMSFIGREEGVAAYASVLVQLNTPHQ